MFAAAGMATMVGRLPDPLTSLVVAAALMGAVDPPVIRDLGFQLSFGATAGLVLLGGRLTPTWRRLPRPVVTALGLTLAAEIFTLPLVLHTFHTLSLVAPVANVLIAPAIPPLMGCAVLAAVASWLPVLGPLVAWPAWLVGHYVLAVIGWTAGLPSARLATGSLPLWGMLAAYGFVLAPLGLEYLGGRLERPRGAAWGRVGLVASLFGLVAVAHLASARSGPSDQLRVRFFDSAGDGLSLLETPSGRRALLGSAGSPLAAAALAEQLPLLDRAIDLLVVTRAGERDLEGLAEIARRYPIALVLQPSTGRGESWSRWTGLLAERSIPIVVASSGLALELGDGAHLEVDDLAEADADRPPNLSLRLLFGSLDLRLVGGATRAPFGDELTAIVRLAPELGLTRELRRQLAPASDHAAVVGGRATAANEHALVQFRLTGSDVVELWSDGAQTRLRRAGCQEASEPCSWP
jgi:competence protein ComEC